MFESARKNSFASTASKVSYDQGLRQYMVKVYNMMAIALGISGVVALVVSNSHELMEALFGNRMLAYLIMFAPLIFVLVFGFKLNSMSAETAKICLFAYSALMGLSLSTIFAAYTTASITQVFFITAAVFGSMSLYGYTTKRDLSGFGSFLMMGLVGLIVVSLVNLFLHSSAMDFMISIVGVFIFLGLTAFNTNQIKQSYYAVNGNAELMSKAAVIGALNLYMDFINLFIMMLRFFGDRR